jgi:hypothetical protein
MPTFVSRLLLGAVIIINALYLLGQRWSVDFYTFVNFQSASLADADHVKVCGVLENGGSREYHYCDDCH